MYDVIIIGSGAAGMSAAVECSKNNLSTLVICKELQGEEEKSEALPEAQDLVLQNFEKLVKEKKIELDKKSGITNIEKNVVSFSVELLSGKILYCRSIIISSCGLLFNLLIYESKGNKIKVDLNMETNVKGIFAVGESNNTGERNVLVSAGEGSKAALEIVKKFEK